MFFYVKEDIISSRWDKMEIPVATIRQYRRVRFRQPSDTKGRYTDRPAAVAVFGLGQRFESSGRSQELRDA